MILRTELERAAQLLTSLRADWEGYTWTFTAPSFQISGGDYLVISLSDWKKIWDKFDGRASEETTDD